MDSELYGFVVEKSFSLFSQDIVMVFILCAYVCMEGGGSVVCGFCGWVLLVGFDLGCLVLWVFFFLSLNSLRGCKTWRAFNIKALGSTSAQSRLPSTSEHCLLERRKYAMRVWAEEASRELIGQQTSSLQFRSCSFLNDVIDLSRSLWNHCILYLSWGKKKQSWDLLLMQVL